MNPEIIQKSRTLAGMLPTSIFCSCHPFPSSQGIYYLELLFIILLFFLYSFITQRLNPYALSCLVLPVLELYVNGVLFCVCICDSCFFCFTWWNSSMVICVVVVHLLSLLYGALLSILLSTVFLCYYKNVAMNILIHASNAVHKNICRVCIQGFN